MKKVIILLWFLVGCLTLQATTYYVATNGSNSNNGISINSPWLTLQYGCSQLVAGDVLYVRAGTYTAVTSTTYGLRIFNGNSNNGTSGSHITVSKYPGDTGEVILNFAAVNGAGLRNGFYMEERSYWDIIGLTVINCNDSGSGANGWGTEGSDHITYTQCTVRHCGNGFGHAGTNDYIYYINCDSHHNADLVNAGDLANGFAANDGVGKHVYYWGCRSWKNCDDGYDMYGGNQYTEFVNCWAFNNGPWKLDGSDHAGNGEGFKTGQVATQSAGLMRLVVNCASFNNDRGYGFDESQDNNYTSSVTHWLYHNTSYKNQGSYNYGYSGAYTDIIRDNISYDEPTADVTGNTSDHNSWNIGALTSNDFESLDSTGVSGPRQANGDLPLLSFLHVKTTSNLKYGGVNVSGYTNYQLDGDKKAWNSPPTIGTYEFGTTGGAILVTNVYIDTDADVRTISTYHGTLQINTTSILPVNATNQTLVWSITNGTGSATVSSSGLVTAVSNGTITVRATATDGSGATDYIVLTISNQTVAGYPTVITLAVTYVTMTSAVSGSNVTSDGGSTVSDRGICWSESSTPTITDSHVHSGTGVGVYSANITGLTAGHTYYVRAFATNSTGTSYGTAISFTASASKIVVFTN